MEFKVRLEKDEDGGSVATDPVLPRCISQRRTAQARKNVRAAMALHLQPLAEDWIPLRRSREVIEAVVAVEA